MSRQKLSTYFLMSHMKNIWPRRQQGKVQRAGRTYKNNRQQESPQEGGEPVPNHGNPEVFLGERPCLPNEAHLTVGGLRRTTVALSTRTCSNVAKIARPGSFELQVADIKMNSFSPEDIGVDGSRTVSIEEDSMGGQR
jgi:hypothetical protein